MIPYDDLVGALHAWRARQGLPVAAPAAGSGPRTAPRAPAPRTNPPTAPPPAGWMAASHPAPLGDVEPHEDLHAEPLEEEHVIEEGQYEHEPNEVIDAHGAHDGAMSFAGDGHNGHATGVNGDDGAETMLGHDPDVEPDRPSDLTDPGAAQRNGRDDW